MSSYYWRATQLTNDIFTELDNQCPIVATHPNPMPLSNGVIETRTLTPEQLEAKQKFKEIRDNLMLFINEYLPV